MRYIGVISGLGQKSLSPLFQQAALDHLRLDFVYQHWPTPVDGLRDRVKGMRAPVVAGANVTNPHKEAALPLMDEVDDLVRKVGALNTIVNRDGALLGYNTDVAGFLRALREDGGFEPAGRRVVVAGAGGAARAVVVALLREGAASVTVINRTAQRAQRLVDDLRPLAQEAVLDVLPDEEAAWQSAVAQVELLVNCTSVGSAGTAEEKDSPVPAHVIHPQMLVYDLIYRPAETPLMAAARERGARVLGGLPMLVYQGAASFEMWTGRQAPVDIMLNAARQASAEDAGLEPQPPEN